MARRRTYRVILEYDKAVFKGCDVVSTSKKAAVGPAREQFLAYLHEQGYTAAQIYQINTIQITILKGEDNGAPGT